MRTKSTGQDDPSFWDERPPWPILMCSALIGFGVMAVLSRWLGW